jgi:pyruvate kinase
MSTGPEQGGFSLPVIGWRLYAACITVATRRTRILATLGPATSDPAIVGEIILAGADAVRLNFSHGDAQAHAESCRMARAEATRLGRALTVLQDLGGPKIRTGRLPAPMLLQSGDTLRIVYGDSAEGPGVVSCNFAPLFTSVTPGQRLLMDDGRLDVVATDVRHGEITTRVLQGGWLDSRKGIHVPGGVVQTPALTVKDHEDLRAGVAMGVDAVALSFVQSPDDILEAREAVRAAGAPGIPIIAKIERPGAVERIRDIVEVSDGIMVARGDLGIELPLETVPAIQKLIILEARRRGVPVIVATEVLESMRTSPRPTRAEVTDAAHAVDEGADAIMLSGETAVGQHPVRTVATLAAIIGEAERALERERHDGVRRLPTDNIRATRHGLALCEAAVALAARAGASAIIAVTKAGMTPRLLSALRPAARIIAATANPQTAARLGLVWGVTPVVTEAATLAAVRETLLSQQLVPAGSTVVFVAMHAALGRNTDNYLLVGQM